MKKVLSYLLFILIGANSLFFSIFTVGKIWKVSLTFWTKFPYALAIACIIVIHLFAIDNFAKSIDKVETK